jgi:methylenetetrahydrofolate dehydrogenase (NADP+) / methenyltetrahydrofolate cyclohydrolase
MAAKVFDGNKLAHTIRAELRQRVDKLREQQGITPGLAVLLIGNNHASRIYVNNKIRASNSVGIRSQLFEFDASVPQSTVMAELERLNQDPLTHGILVQLPLPHHLDLYKVLHKISVDKDVDGFCLYNVGGLIVGDTIFSPCTPYGVMKILDSEGISVEGQNVVIVGASNIVGKPLAMMMMRREATVAVCHIKTKELAQFTIHADILIVAAGVPNLILPQMVKTGAVVIDVGVNRLPDGKIVGDVDFAGVSRKASFITPVPGGVGPMTVTMLLANTITAAEHHCIRRNEFRDRDEPELVPAP